MNFRIFQAFLESESELKQNLANYLTAREEALIELENEV